MSSALCRRQFISRGFILAGAALLLPSQPLFAASSPAAGNAPGPVTEEDAAHRTVLALARRYGEVAAVRAEKSVTRITVHISCFTSMGAALGGARSHGISHVEARGNVTSFELGGRRFELENLHTSA